MPNIKKAAKKASKALAKEAAKTLKDERRMRAIGSSVGGLIGGSKGNQIGGRAGALAAKIFGHGDYTIYGNSLINSGITGMAPSAGIPTFEPTGKGGLRVREREYLGDVYSSGTLVSGSSTFSLASFEVNPGLQNSFPWLHAIAQNFDQWEPNGIIFEFRSTSSAYNGTNQALGTIIMATEYDVADSVYQNKVEMENSDYACSAASNSNLIHALECSVEERERRLYAVRSGAVPTDDVKRNYDLANFQIATVGVSATNVNLGELWVSYDITFYKKQLHTLFGRNLAWAMQESSTGITNTNFLGTNSLVRYGGGITPVFTATTNGLIVTVYGAVPQAVYEVCFELEMTGGTAVSVNSPSSITGANKITTVLETNAGAATLVSGRAFLQATATTFTYTWTAAANPLATGSAVRHNHTVMLANPNMLSLP